MYRVTRKANDFRHQEALRRGKDQARADRPAPEYPPDRPDLRLEIIVRRHDCGELIEHHFRFHDTRRVDVYRITCNGAPWQARLGLSRAVALIRKAIPRLPSPRSMF